MVSTSVEKLFEIDSHIGCAVSGLTADAKMLVEHARVEAQVIFLYNILFMY
jgi:20S proteasome subunit alpha 5